MATADPIQVTLNYALDHEAPGSFEFPFVTLVHSDGSPNGKSLYLQPAQTPIHDLRTAPEQPTLDKAGFAWEAVPYANLQNGGPGKWEDEYAEAMAEWMKGYSRARACVPINYQIRRRTDGASAGNNYKGIDVQDGKQPVSAVHVDINRERATKRVLDAYKDRNAVPADYKDGNRVAIINVWRPLRGPVIDAPLAMCDARSWRKEDIIRTTDQYGGGYFLRLNKNMKWFFVRDQMPDELLIFRQYDSSLVPEEGNMHCGAHTAFIDKEREHLGLPRESIEVRLALIY
ncbi:uncharacterized protein BXZ73DRAFT_99642 [Epithele typhae]|uniref:uncharacterized protein n=1 Tax=Epithele typhae TaxID=378194 RepID=UPI002008631E|nr:uncharacterized protein BXZ73DRAFT_99642 [Epithele typhae]KAH9938965.1 hypothetical protein BXZ73DRAFT_99642 [Epithele typhae]